MRRTALAALCLAAAATAGLTGCLPGQDKADSKPKGPFAGQSGGQIAERARLPPVQLHDPLSSLAPKPVS